MKKLGLTGSIATGKSTILKIFSELGYAIFSADDEVHQIYKRKVPLQIKSFYPPAFKKDQVDRNILAKYLLENPKKLTDLEALVHPLVNQRYEDFIRTSKNQNQQLIIADIPLLFESKYDYGFDAIAVSFCSPQIQKKRALSRQGMTEKKLQVILDRQIDQENKKQRADYLIDTNGSIQKTREQVKNIITKILPTSIN
ncbi:MAG: dephospho-CoA kinase [Devosiaceae bacterium]|nr:dephospho-CoA kinase [Devosiaceae bacterium]